MTVPNASGATMYTVDIDTADGPARTETLTSDTIVMNAFAVSIVVFNN